MSTATPISLTPPAAGAEPAARAGRPTITPRTPGLALAGVPRDWFGGEVVATHMVNGINLLFPAGERFFVRSVHHYLDRITDPELLAAVRGFSQQEGRHARAHEQFFATLRAQGYRIDGFLRAYQWLAYRVIERLAPPALRLSATAACEHFTAIMAEAAAGELPLELAHPALRQLLYWHAAEELEHKSVAFDVLEQVAPSYPVRIAGLAVTTAMLGGLWWAAMMMLLAQDRVTPVGAVRRLRALRRETRQPSVLRRVFARGIGMYLRRDFHPDRHDNYHLAGELLARAAAAGREAAAAAAEVA